MLLPPWKDKDVPFTGDFWGDSSCQTLAEKANITVERNLLLFCQVKYLCGCWNIPGKCSFTALPSVLLGAQFITCVVIARLNSFWGLLITMQSASEIRPTMVSASTRRTENYTVQAKKKKQNTKKVRGKPSAVKSPIYNQAGYCRGIRAESLCVRMKMGAVALGVRAAAEHQHPVTAFAMLVPGATAFGQLVRKTGTHLGEHHSGLGRKAEWSSRTDEAQGEESVCVTDRFPQVAVKLGKHIMFWRLMRWDACSGNPL